MTWARRRGSLGPLSFVAILLSGVTLVAQRSNVDALLLRLRDERPLDAAEVRLVQQATREMLAYKALRLRILASGTAAGPSEVEVLMGTDGRPLWLRETGARPDWRRFQPGRTSGTAGADDVTLTQYTRRAAKRCDGTLTADELVVEYRNDASGWTASTRLITGRELGAPLFAVLAGEVVVRDAGRLTLEGRQLRALAAAWSPEATTARRSSTPRLVAPRGTDLALGTQTLSVDEQTLLPASWQLSLATSRDGTPPNDPYELRFSYDPSTVLTAPTGVDVPPCVP